MDYAASLRNIEILKNFIRPYNCKHIYFDFYSATEFKTEIFTEKDSEFIESAMLKCHKEKVPYARILIEQNEHEVLYYHDGRFFYEYDLTIDQIIEFRSLSHTEYKSGSMKLQMLQLIRQLKNSG